MFSTTGCKVELGVLMDESGSISDDDFRREKNFVAELAKGFSNFGPNGVQMGVVSYSTYANVDIKLKAFSNKADFMKAVDRIRHRGETELLHRNNIVSKYRCYLKWC